MIYRSWYRWLGFPLAGAFIIGANAFVYFKFSYNIRPLYWDEEIVLLPSPTGAWTARVVEYVMEGGMAGLSSTDDGVELIANLHPDSPIKLLWVNTTGTPDYHPIISWVTPDTLQITVKNFSNARLLAESAAGVKVEVRFDTDATVAEWLKRREGGAALRDPF